MSSGDDNDDLDGLEPTDLFREALGDSSGNPEAAARDVEEQQRVRAEVEARLPDLELGELIGRGGMGYVFHARQTKLDRDVAVKVIAPESDVEASFAERFAREAQALARLSHPNLVAVYDYGQQEGFGWLLIRQRFRTQDGL